MDFKKYQQLAQQTVHEHPDPLMNKTIWVLGISGEASEIAEKWKKTVAYNDGAIDQALKDDLTKEMGDVMWYLAAFAESLGISLQDVAEQNIEKVISRKNRGVIKGAGDNR